MISVCSSNEGGIRSEDDGFQLVCEDGWLRGVTVAGSTRYLGVSQNLAREAREDSDCSVLKLDNTGAVSACYTFQGFGMLHDIRSLGALDPTHNGIGFQLSVEALGKADLTYRTTGHLLELRPPRETADAGEPLRRRLPAHGTALPSALTGG